MEEMIKLLERLGFTLYESKIVIWISSQSGYKTAKQIAEGSGVPLSRIYSILLKFEKLDIIKKFPGREYSYSIIDKDVLIEIISKNKESEIEKEKEETNTLCKMLNEKLSEVQKKFPSEVDVKYYTDNDAYWKDYVSATSKLKKNDRYRIINNIRLSSSFLREEIDKMSPEQRIVSKGMEYPSGTIVHYMLNPKALVERIIFELKANDKIIESISAMLEYLDQNKKYYCFTIAPEMKNILITIVSDSVFLEFYGMESARISSAIRIKNEKIAKDFMKWFDGFDKIKKHESKKEFNEFKEDVLKWAEKLAKIKPKEIEKFI